VARQTRHCATRILLQLIRDRTDDLLRSIALFSLHALRNSIPAAAAAVPSHMFQKMGRRLKEARDLGSYELVERLGEGGWARCGARGIGCSRRRHQVRG
jgi:hypothetical protein